MTEASQLGPTENGTVMLDIGGEIGALVLHTSQQMLGAEIEISPVTEGDSRARGDVEDDHSHDHATHPHDHTHPHNGSHRTARTHVAVRERRGPVGSQYAAIFYGLREGEYTLWDLQGQPADTVRIVGGHVAELDWR